MGVRLRKQIDIDERVSFVCHPFHELLRKIDLILGGKKKRGKGIGYELTRKDFSKCALHVATDCNSICRLPLDVGISSYKGRST